MALVQDDCNGGCGLDAVSHQAALAADDGLSAIERVKGSNFGDTLRGIDLSSLDAIVGSSNDALTFIGSLTQQEFHIIDCNLRSMQAVISRRP